MSRPLITLLTDFGTADSYVAEMKAALLAAVPEATLVDLTHAVPPGDLRAAAYLLGRTWHRFPRGTVHLAVVDPGVGTARAALAFGAGGHWFVGPDNGLFTPVLRDAAVEIVSLPLPATAAPTFHGRDLFAPAAAALAGGTPLEELGEPFRGIPHRLSYREPRYEGKSVVGEVVYVDRFGTLVTNLITPALPASIAAFVGVTAMPGFTCCSPLMTITSFAASPLLTTRRPSTLAPSVTGRYSSVLSDLQREHELLAKIGADRALVDQDRLARLAADELDACEQARREAAVLVVEHRAAADRAALRIDLVVDEVEAARVRIALLVDQAHEHRVLAAVGAVARSAVRRELR